MKVVINKQVIALVSIGVFAVGGMGLASYFAQNKSEASPGYKTTKRFTAKPGTTRKNAVALTSDKRAPDESPVRSRSSTEDQSPLRVRSLSPTGKENKLSPSKQLSREALNSRSPERGIEKLEQALATSSHSPEEEAQLRATLALLLAQQEPPDFERSQEMLHLALGKAPSRTLRQELVFQHAQMLLMNSMPGRAREEIESALAEHGPTTAEELRLNILLGQLDESDGNSQKAEQIYSRLVEQIFGLPETLGKDSSGILRLAGLRLTQQYRQSGREKEAKALEKRLNAHFEAQSDTPD
jgi:hypothetical protein